MISKFEKKVQSATEMWIKPRFRANECNNFSLCGPYQTETTEIIAEQFNHY